MGAIIKQAASCLNNVKEDLLEECDFEHKKIDSYSPVVEIQFYGFNFPALIDTGSMVCAINEEVWGQLENFHAIIPSFPCTGVKVSGAFLNKQRQVKRQVLLTFFLQKKRV